MRANGHTQPRDPDEQLKDQEEVQAHAAAAQESVRTAAAELRERKDKFLDKLGDPDVDSTDYPTLSEDFGPDFSLSHILANKDEEDLQRDLWLTENEIERIIHEHEPGRLCDGPFAALMQGVHNRPDRPRFGTLTGDEQRKIREAGKVKYSRLTLGTGTGVDSVSKIQTVNEIDRGESESDGDAGRAAKAYRRVFG